MMSKAFAFLAVASLVGEAVAAAAHGHGHLHRNQKKDVVTEWETVTDWVTVTVAWEGSSSKVFVENTHTPLTLTASNTSTTTTTSTSTSTSTATSISISTSTATSISTTPISTSTATSIAVSTTSIPPPTTSSSVAPTTLTTQATSSVPTAEINVLGLGSSSSAKSSSVATAVVPPAPTSVPNSSSGSVSRGLAYNDGSLLSLFAGSKAGWKYNWGQTDDSAEYSSLPFVPMLWGTGSDHTSSWESNANAAIAQGSNCLLSFNEPDNPGQSDLTPSVAAQAHIQYMNPFSSKAQIGSPAITNSEQPNQGIDWLTQFISACGGQCALDFVVCHWYNPANATEFVEHLAAVHEASGNLPVWVTEFEPLGASDEETASFLTEVFQLLDTPQYSFVDRVAFFMVATGNLADSSSALSTFGQTYAFS